MSARTGPRFPWPDHWARAAGHLARGRRPCGPCASSRRSARPDERGAV